MAGLAFPLFADSADAALLSALIQAVVSSTPRATSPPIAPFTLIAGRISKVSDIRNPSAQAVGGRLLSPQGLSELVESCPVHMIL